MPNECGKSRQFASYVIMYSVFSAYEYVIPASGKTVALTDLQIALPPGCYGRIGKMSYFDLFFI